MLNRYVIQYTRQDNTQYKTRRLQYKTIHNTRQYTIQDNTQDKTILQDKTIHNTIQDYKTIQYTIQYIIQDNTQDKTIHKTRQYKVSIITKCIVNSIYHADQQI